MAVENKRDSRILLSGLKKIFPLSSYISDT